MSPQESEAGSLREWEDRLDWLENRAAAPGAFGVWVGTICFASCLIAAVLFLVSRAR